MFGAARWRLVGWNVLVLTLILVFLETVVYTVFNNQIYNGVDNELRNRAHQAVITIAQQSLQGELMEAGADETYRMVVLTPDGSRVSADCYRQQRINLFVACTPQSAALVSPEAADWVRTHEGLDIRTAWYAGTPVRVATFLAGWGGAVYIVQLSRTAAGEVDALKRLRWLIIVGTIFGVILSAVGSLFLANKALIPIRQAFLRQRQFTADASHELRTPLALIRANAEMLERHGDRLSPGDEELVGEIIRETDHLNRLVGDLLTLARADAETVKIETKPVDFRSLVSEVHEDVQRIAESRGIESDISLDGPVTVPGDEVRLRQLLLILLDNALKYTDPGGKVDVALQRQDGRAHLMVADTGIGIPREDLGHIFERFYRVDRAREHESGGTGLGLSIAQWIVQAHNGTIKVDSEVGRGTTFQIDLPAA